MTEQANRYELRNRYLFTGTLVLQTAMHIGGGKVTLSSSDSPVVLTPEEIPFIPGSSFKGALRSTVEKLAPSLPGNWRSCGLIELDDEQAQAARERKEVICPTVRQRDVTQERRSHPGQEERILREARERLCHTCQLFGSPFAASHIAISDLYMPEGEWNGIIQMRDGVAIDRDSEKAKDRLKYDFEVVPASATFALEMVLENATPQDRQLISVGLSEFVHGFSTIGGKRSRGLGVCKLENLRVYTLELVSDDERPPVSESERNKRLRNYLLGRKLNEKFHLEEEGQVFIEKHIASLFSSSSL